MSAKTTGIVLGVSGAVLVGLVAASALVKQIQRRDQALAKVPAAAAGPVEEIDAEEPLKVLTYVNGRKGRAREEALADVVGKYTPKAGWDGTITAITNESGGRVALRMQYPSATTIGGEYWVVALVGKNHGAKEGQAVRVAGKIKDVVFKTGPASVIQSVVLEDARIMPLTRGSNTGPGGSVE